MNHRMHTTGSAGHGVTQAPRRSRSTDRLRQAAARRRLEQYREDRLLRERLYDVFSDELM